MTGDLGDARQRTSRTPEDDEEGLLKKGEKGNQVKLKQDKIREVAERGKCGVCGVVEVKLG